MPATASRRKTPAEISYNMSRIHSKDTKIEKMLGSAMFSIGLRYRKQYKALGRPDFAFPKQKVAVFCDSSFWHGRDWSTAKEKIKVRREFWIPKIERNIQRDKEVVDRLESEGWLVIRFWDCQIESDPESCAAIVKEEVLSRKGLT
jgi:DNA mismatch endonuclease Vsr